MGTRLLIWPGTPHPLHRLAPQPGGGRADVPLPLTGRQGRAVGASFSAMPGPLACGLPSLLSRVVPPAAWVGWGREGVVTAVRLTPSPNSRRLEGTSYIRRSSREALHPPLPSLSGDQA